MIELDHEEIIAAIGFYLESRGASADLGSVQILVGEGGLSARLEGERADPLQEVDGSDLDHDAVGMARCPRDTVDVVSGEPLEEGAPCLWIDKYGVTAAPPDRWPEEVRQRTALSDAQIETIREHLGVRTGETMSTEEIVEMCERLSEVGIDGAHAKARRLSEDSFTGEPIEQGADVVWISGEGVTRATAERWPAHLRAKVLGERPSSEARTAADVLGGAGGGEALGRGDALSRGVKKG